MGAAQWLLAAVAIAVVVAEGESGAEAEAEVPPAAVVPEVEDTLPSLAAPPSEELPVDGCVIAGYYYEEDADTVKLMAATAMDCQTMCTENVFCSSFTFWPNGTCHGFGGNAMLRNGTAECTTQAGATDAECERRLAISGARQCGEAYRASYPFAAVSAGAGGAATPLPAADVESWGPGALGAAGASLGASVAGSGVGGGMRPSWALIVGIALGVVACVGGSVWGMRRAGATSPPKKRKRGVTVREEQRKGDDEEECEALLPDGGSARSTSSQPAATEKATAQSAARPFVGLGARPLGPMAQTWHSMPGAYPAPPGHFAPRPPQPMFALQPLSIQPVWSTQSWASQPLRSFQAACFSQAQPLPRYMPLAASPLQSTFLEPQVPIDYSLVQQDSAHAG